MRNNANGSVFIAHGPSYVWNESLDRKQLEAEKLRDPRRYAREIEAQFVDAINPLLDGDSIEAACEGRSEIPLRPNNQHSYVGAVDIGLRRDSTALTIAYRDDDSGELPRVIVAGTWRWAPAPGQPLDISRTVRSIVQTCNDYSVRSLTADQFSFDSVKELFRREGLTLIEHVWCGPSKAQKFGLLRDLLVDGRLSLPAHPRLLTELKQLDETILPSGNVRIAGRGRSHDDMAFSLALAVGEVSLTAPCVMDLWERVAQKYDPEEFAYQMRAMAGLGGRF